MIAPEALALVRIQFSLEQWARATVAVAPAHMAVVPAEAQIEPGPLANRCFAKLAVVRAALAPLVVAGIELEVVAVEVAVPVDVGAVVARSGTRLARPKGPVQPGLVEFARGPRHTPHLPPSMALVD